MFLPVLSLALLHGYMWFCTALESPRSCKSCMFLIFTILSAINNFIIPKLFLHKESKPICSIRELKQTTTTVRRTSPNKRFND